MDASIFQSYRWPPSGRPIRFQDADFERRLAWCWSPLEGRSRRWIPFGMPRISQVYLDSVFFLFGQSPETGKVGPVGTGVLIGYPGQHGPFRALHRHIYAITCQHVVWSGASSIRINRSKGQHRFIEIEPDEWQFIPGGADLAAVDVTERIFEERREVAVIPQGFLVDKDFIKREELGVGEDGFMLGLFADLHGTHRNLVAYRYGNICLLADEAEPLLQPNGTKGPAHIFDMRSRPGFSGSPVFVYRTPAGDLRNATERGEEDIRRQRALEEAHRRGTLTPFGAAAGMRSMREFDIRGNTFMMLLGIHAGQYHDWVTVRKAPPIRGELDVNIVEGDRLSIPNSMAVVIPAWEIATLLNLDVFTKQRNVRDAEDKRKFDEANVAVPEASLKP
jgi:hypothetical protein